MWAGVPPPHTYPTQPTVFQEAPPPTCPASYAPHLLHGSKAASELLAEVSDVVVTLFMSFLKFSRKFIRGFSTSL